MQRDFSTGFLHQQLSKKTHPLTDLIRQRVLALIDCALELCQPPQRDTETAIHDLRVHLKQLRAYWLLIRYSVSANDFNTANQRIRNSAKNLGGLRDQQVLVESIQTLREKLAAPNQKVADLLITQLNLSLEKAQIEASIDWPEIMKTLEVEKLFWQSFQTQPNIDINCAIERGLQETWHKNWKLAKKATVKHAEEMLRHRWRKWVKHIYYQLKLLKAMKFKSHAKLIQQLDMLGQALGQEHDFQVLLHFLIQKSLDHPELKVGLTPLIRLNKSHLKTLNQQVNQLDTALEKLSP